MAYNFELLNHCGYCGLTSGSNVLHFPLISDFGLLGYNLAFVSHYLSSKMCYYNSREEMELVYPLCFSRLRNSSCVFSHWNALTDHKLRPRILNWLW